jgi:hypothetical protein
MKKIIAFFLICIFQLPVSAANSGTDVMFISGNVVDQKTHETLAGVQVHVKATTISVYTDFDGNFFLPDLPRGSYELEFNYITYKSSQIVTDNCDHCSTLAVEISQE